MGRAGAVQRGWLDRMTAELGRMGRMVEAMLSGLVRRLKMGNVLPVCLSVRFCQVCLDVQEEGKGSTISWAGLGWAGGDDTAYAKSSWAVSRVTPLNGTLTL